MFRFGAATTGRRHGRPLKRSIYLAAALVLVWVATQLLPSPAPDDRRFYSDEAGTVATGSEAASGIIQTEAGRLITPGRIAALVLLAAGCGVAVFLRRKGRPSEDDRTTLKSIGKLQLAPGQQLHLVSCGEDVLLLGATGSQITLLKTLPQTKELSPSTRPYRREDLVRPGATHAGTPAFGDLLRRLASEQRTGRTIDLS